MEKKDVVFLATSVMVASRMGQTLPAAEKSPDDSGRDYFTKWYQFLSARYEECSKLPQK